ncbi:hypothetical protein [Micromonospora deserti]|uniref:hypothetical protein n=1 Tax=Micromonospora deserti TaxID=2070366 RepID=UPI0018F2CF63|nr:hypothetical protein [Micromonospora deserti]
MALAGGADAPVGVAGSSGDSVAVGVPVGDESGGGTERVAVGSGEEADPPVGDAVGEGLALGDGTGADVPRGGRDAGGGSGCRADPGAGACGAAPGTTGVRGPVGRAVGGAAVTDGAGVVAVSAGWLATGSGITTGPTEGVGMNGVLLSGRAELPTVADPVLMAARIGMDAVPASRATVKR